MRFSNKGFSLVEVLVASGIMCVIAMGFASYMTNQNKEFRALAETLSSQDLTKAMIGALAKGDVCHYILSTKTFNANEVVTGNPQVVDIGTQPLYATMVSSGVPGPSLIKKGDKASNYTTSLVVDGIQFKVMSGVIDGASGSFVGQWEVVYDRSKSVRNVKPSIATATIKATIDGSGNATTISCLGSGTSGSGTEGHLSKWNTMSELGDSIVFQDSVNDRIGIGTNTPTQTLDVNGTAKVTGVLSTGKIQMVDVVTDNSACPQTGLVARNVTGVLLSCQEGIWKKATGAGSNGTSRMISSTNQFTLSNVNLSCDSDETLTSCSGEVYYSNTPGGGSPAPTNASVTVSNKSCSSGRPSTPFYHYTALRAICVK